MNKKNTDSIVADAKPTNQNSQENKPLATATDKTASTPTDAKKAASNGQPEDAKVLNKIAIVAKNNKKLVSELKKGIKDIDHNSDIRCSDKVKK